MCTLDHETRKCNVHACKACTAYSSKKGSPVHLLGAIQELAPQPHVLVQVAKSLSGDVAPDVAMLSGD